MPFDSKIQVIQNRLALSGFNVGSAGADGLWGNDTYAALISAFDKFGIGKTGTVVPVERADGPIPVNWLDGAKMTRIVCHWSAGGYVVSEIDKEHYHFIVGGDGKIVKGDHDVSDNASTSDGDYAAHTLNCNTGSIGVSMACMAGAIESPFNAGAYPMRKGQWDIMVKAVAQLCEHYGIAVSPKTVLSHAEVQANLGIQQRGKWDFTRLPFDPSVVGAAAVGLKLRTEVAAAMEQ